MNPTISIKGSKLIIEVDMNGATKPSATGKTNILSTTSGFVGVPGTDIKVSLNVTKPNAASAKA